VAWLVCLCWVDEEREEKRRERKIVVFFRVGSTRFGFMPLSRLVYFLKYNNRNKNSKKMKKTTIGQNNSKRNKKIIM